MPRGFPHSEISGSKVARHLPETYRSHATSFIAILSQGIHHTLLNFPLGNLKTTDLKSRPLVILNLYFILLHKINCITVRIFESRLHNSQKFPFIPLEIRNFNFGYFARDTFTFTYPRKKFQSTSDYFKRGESIYVPKRPRLPTGDES